ncbi:hypothetical protein ABC766_00415 [Methylobacterium fujisawaense]|uniref:hypothetical protein n=1 Tax=Methylobacterium fujisawaense TaxID=107400 RepID=UPI0031F4D134
MPTNNLLPFATGDGALVLSDSAYASDTARQTGFQNGIADPAHVNKVWRQGAFGASVLGQVLVAYGLVDANDDGDVVGFAAKLRASIAAMLSSAIFGVDTSTTANAISVALDPAPPQLTNYRQLFVRVANTNTGSVTIALNALGSKTAVRKNGTPLQMGDLLAGQIAHFLYDSQAGQWVLAGFANGEVPRITTTATLYVRTDATNTSPDGSANTAAAAFPTIASAIQYGANRFYLPGKPLTIQLGNPGTYAPPGNINVGGQVIIQGDPANQALYSASGVGPSGGGSSLFGAVGTNLSLNGLTVQNTGTINSHLGAVGSGSISTGNVTFASSVSTGQPYVLATQGGSATLFSGCIGTGFAGSIFNASGGFITLASNLSIQGTPSFTSAAAIASANGVIALLTGVSISGPAVGARYLATTGGRILVNGAGPNVFPGNAAGSADSVSTYA